MSLFKKIFKDEVKDKEDGKEKLSKYVKEIIRIAKKREEN